MRASSCVDGFAGAALAGARRVSVVTLNGDELARSDRRVAAPVRPVAPTRVTDLVEDMIKSESNGLHKLRRLESTRHVAKGNLQSWRAVNS